MPTAIPAADGAVRTRAWAPSWTPAAPELCLGAVAESYPPQCGGLPIAGWDWEDHDGVFEREGDIRWGLFAVTGTCDGTTFTVTDAVPARSTTRRRPRSRRDPAPAVDAHRRGARPSIAETLGADLPGAQGAYGADGHVLVDVTYDDGTLQALGRRGVRRERGRRRPPRCVDAR